MRAEQDPPREIRPFQRWRKVIVDAGRASRSRHPMIGLIEVDVTEARRRIASHQEATGDRISFTAFVASCVARAVVADRGVQAYRDLRGRLIVFDDVDINILMEVTVDGRPFPMNHVVRAADKRTVLDIHREIRSIQHDPSRSETAALARSAAFLTALPSFIRATGIRSLHRLPVQQKKLVGTVAVDAVGMFGRGGGWGISFLLHSLQVVVGGISVKPAYVDGVLEPRGSVDLTLAFDHDVIDGAPAARFAKRLRELIEAADGIPPLNDVGASSEDARRAGEPPAR
jgi:pyruvate/2-oxoglutarate dehydrogenase complex dihydrolipoamide acyltransferase (E2) component